MKHQDHDWSGIYNHLRESLYEQQIVCSMSTQLYYMPETEDLEGNPEMHEHLVPASYHRVTAVGSAKRLMKDEAKEPSSIVQSLRSCIENAQSEDQGVMRWLHVMRDEAPSSFSSFIQRIITRQEKAEKSLKEAQQQMENEREEREEKSQTLEEMAVWCDDIDWHWQQMKPIFAKVADQKNLEGWEQKLRNLKGKVHAASPLETMDFQTAQGLYDQWESLYHETQEYRSF
ncbi:hypothetical protein [Salicibibacter halophilus]|uniref:hypothetical protein n=1 Tax=Salicibibacter halophilus TaxID=2502791 RepID=UPI0018752509|nr:hypothetical protein [Salicibibacter halophilus]